jgi:hypothetical protein
MVATPGRRDNQIQFYETNVKMIFMLFEGSNMCKLCVTNVHRARFCIKYLIPQELVAETYSTFFLIIVSFFLNIKLGRTLAVY